MAITEDYVSFETAKLLKKKGFDEKCNSYFISNNEIALIANKRNFNKHGIYLSAPTLQRAMKWLREVHDIKIMIRPYADGTYGYEILNGFWYVNFDSYEDACEAAIKYCLENLIQNNYEEKFKPA